MGCCASGSKELKEPQFPISIDAEVFGRPATVLVRKFLENAGSKSMIMIPALPSVPKFEATAELMRDPSRNVQGGPSGFSQANAVASLRASTAREGTKRNSPMASNGLDWIGLEFGFQYYTSTRQVPSGLSPWDAKATIWFNAALAAQLQVSSSSPSFVCGREQILFLGVSEPLEKQGKVQGVVLLSTGSIVVFKAWNTVLEAVYHLFDIKSVGVDETGGQYQVTIDLAHGFVSGPPLCKERVRDEDQGQGQSPPGVCFHMSKDQTMSFIDGLMKLSWSLRNSPVDVRTPASLKAQTNVPRPPCDGGFLAVLHATCSYFGKDLNRLCLGEAFFAGIPLLELDISGFESLDAVLAIGIRAGLARSMQFRSLVRTGTAEFSKPIPKPAWNELLPIFEWGTLFRIHLPYCEINGTMVVELAKALCKRASNTAVDLDISGAEIPAGAGSVLANCLASTPGSLRELALAQCRWSSPAEVMPILNVLKTKTAKIESLNISGNPCQVSEDTHPLKAVWNSKLLKRLDISFTGLNLTKVVQGLSPENVRSLKFLNISGLRFPPKEVAEAFFSLFGNEIETVVADKCFQTADDVACFLSALAKMPSPSLRLDLRNVGPAFAGVGIAGSLPDKQLVLSRPPNVSSFKMWESAIINSFIEAASKGKKGTEGMQFVYGETFVNIKKSEKPEVIQEMEEFSKVIQTSVLKALIIDGELPDAALGPTSLTFSLQAGPAKADHVTVNLEGKVGAGPVIALALQGVAQNKSLKMLDLTNCTGGDFVALELGMNVLRQNRTLRSLHIGGNYFSHNGLAAIRGAFYGNKVLLELPFPEADSKRILGAYEQRLQALNREVLQSRSEIKAAFKRTKGAKTAQVVQVLNREVERIKVRKTEMSRLRQTMAKYAKLQKEIQEAIQRNQKDAKNLARLDKEKTSTCKTLWKKAAKALNAAKELQGRRAQTLEHQQKELWRKRKDLREMWMSKYKTLKKQKHDVGWLESWLQSVSPKEARGSGDGTATSSSALETKPLLDNTNAQETPRGMVPESPPGAASKVKESVPLTTREAFMLHPLLLSIPKNLQSSVKNEVSRTEKHIKFEQDLLAEREKLESEAHNQMLTVARLQSHDNWAPPPAGENYPAELSKPVSSSPVRPPPAIVQGTVVGVPVAMGAGSNVTTGTVIAAPVVAVPPSAAQQQSRYEQYRIFRAEQSLHRRSYVANSLPTREGAKFKQGRSHNTIASCTHQGGGLGYTGVYMYSRYRDQQQQNQIGSFSVTFRPGQAGLTIEDDGHVSFVVPGGQAELGGVTVGMRAISVGGLNNEPIRLLFERHMGGNRDYVVVFVRGADRGGDYYDDGYYYYGGCYGYYGYYDPMFYPMYYNAYSYEECGWAESHYHADDYHDDWGNEQFDAAPPDGDPMDSIDLEAMHASEGAVDMYAGGEDERPGRGSPPPDPDKCWTPIPPRLDLAEWFEEKIRGAEKSAQEVVLGRSGPLPCYREVILQTNQANSSQPFPSICLVTQCSLDRLGRLEEQLIHWDGELSAAVYISAAPCSEEAVVGRRQIFDACGRAALVRLSRGATAPVCTITALYQLADDEIRCASYDRLYPVNTLRNTALANSRAEMVFLLDVDFVPSEGLFTRLSGSDNGEKLCAGLKGHGFRAPTALVVPAFETKRASCDVPHSSAALRTAFEAGHVEGFHVSHFPKGHRATDFQRWFAHRAAEDSLESVRFVEEVHGFDAYRVDYEEHFEPYIVLPRAIVPAYDERFRGYGLNKISHLYELSTRGVSFHVINDTASFVVAAKHDKSQSWQQCYGPDAEAEQRARIAVHYAAFKAELHAELSFVRARLLAAEQYFRSGRSTRRRRQETQRRRTGERRANCAVGNNVCLRVEENLPKHIVA